MCISHEYQRKLRVQEEEKQTAASNTARLETTVKVLNILKLAEECTAKLHLKLHRPWNKNELEGASLVDFSSCSCKLLKAFIHSRMFSELTPPKAMKWKWPNKGTVNGFHGDGRSLITLAYSVRVEPIKLIEAGVGTQEGIRGEHVAAHESLVVKFEKDPWFNQPSPSSFLSSKDFIGNFYSSGLLCNCYFG